MNLLRPNGKCLERNIDYYAKQKKKSLDAFWDKAEVDDGEKGRAIEKGNGGKIRGRGGVSGITAGNFSVESWGGRGRKLKWARIAGYKKAGKRGEKEARWKR